MKRIEVALNSGSYPALLGSGLLRDAGELLAETIGSAKAVVVTDENVARAGISLGLGQDPIILPAGEQVKSWSEAGKLLETLLERGVDRGDVLIALGGGTVGDLVGFAASVLKRGCRHVQVPTTLLAQADSCVGGKTAVNMKQGKNLVGSFHQPAAVLIDPATLATLPDRELRAGYAEVVKYGLVGDPTFFAWCEANAGRLLRRDEESLLAAIETSLRSKAAIVVEDERDLGGRRALLNFGHTFGHALEAATGFSDQLLHGEAVAVGMTLAFRFSVERGLCPPDDAERVERHLAAAGFTNLRDLRLEGQAATLVGHMENDKKKLGGRLSFILTGGIGRAFVDQSVEPGAIMSFLSRELS